MLVCPQCQFENHNHCQYCQKCGASLTHKACLSCGNQVAFNVETCPECDALTAASWWAIIADSGSEDLCLPDAVGDVYLDSGKRYRCYSLDKDAGEGRVIDCQPLQKSFLKVLLEQEQELSGAEPQGQLERFRSTAAWIPPLALPYLAVPEFFPAVPPLHDAWQEGSRQVILLPDRSGWQLLTDWWANQSLPLLSIIYGLDEMAKLWEALAAIGHTQSLLIPSNLRFDEDQSLGLQRLYPDSPASPPTLLDLAQLWQELCQIRPLPSAQDLQDLLTATARGEVATVKAIRRQLQKLAHQQQLEGSVSSQDLQGSEEGTPLLFWPEVVNQEKDYLQTDSEEQTWTETSGDDLPTAVIPMKLLSIMDAGYSDNGRQRPHNEDCFSMNTCVFKQQGNQGRQLHAKALYIICDGMGGHAAGEVASALAVQTLQHFFQIHWPDGELPSREVIYQGIVAANQAIYQVNQEKASCGIGRMGTTLAMALVQDTQVMIAHVGDSRIYQVNRRSGLKQLTVDHEVGQQAIQEGIAPAIAYSRPEAYQLTQALGPHGQSYIKPSIQFLTLNEDTLLLLCSDGLSDNNFLENQCSDHLLALLSSGANLEQGLQQLIALGNQTNGHDNLTAILVRIKVQPDLGQL